jgi:hypothetical protein
MLFEKDFLSWLQGLETIREATNGVWFEKADEGQEEPFVVIVEVTAGGAREAGVLHPFLHLDCYAKDRFGAVALAEKVAGAIHGAGFTEGDTVFGKVTAERSAPLEMEDGTWKVPVIVRFSCQRRH